MPIVSAMTIITCLFFFGQLARRRRKMKPTTLNRSLESGFLTVRELTARWKMSRRQVDRYIESGELEVHRFGRSIRISMDDILLFELRRRRVR
jgi:excisionase family DNA binding protein